VKTRKTSSESAAGRFVQRWGTFLIAGVLLCGAWAYVFASLAEYKQRLLDERQRELTQLNSAVASQSAGLLTVAETHLRTLDKFIQANPKTDPRTDPHFVALAEMLKTSSNGMVELRMVSVEGKLYYITSPVTDSTANVPDKVYVTAQHASSNQNLYIGDPVLSGATDKWSIPISWRLEAPVSGMLVMFAAIDLERVFAAHEQLRLKPAGTVTLIHDRGIVLSHTPPDATLIGKPISTSAPDGLVADGLQRLVSYDRLQRYPVNVLVTESVQEVLAPYLHRRNVTFTVSVGVTVGLLLLAFSLQRFVRGFNAAQQALERAATIDSLTGIMTRRNFLEVGAREFSRAHRYGRPAVVLALDIDHFKNVNDSYGHAKGDTVLRECCAAWMTVLREQDFLGRIGGEEFSAILPETGIEGAARVADRLRELTGKLRFAGDDSEFGITVSIGMATVTPTDEALAQVMERADKALYLAKRHGRNRVETLETVTQGGATLIPIAG
jgi:diguanylate cyclase (GGDEF)-like protein